MKHVTFADKAVLMGDDAADTLLEYARVIAGTSGADSVTLQAISPDGNTVDASFLLNANTVLMVESTNSDVEPPENADAVREMRDRIKAICQPATADAATSVADRRLRPHRRNVSRHETERTGGLIHL